MRWDGKLQESADWGLDLVWTRSEPPDSVLHHLRFRLNLTEPRLFNRDDERERLCEVTTGQTPPVCGSNDPNIQILT